MDTFGVAKVPRFKVPQESKGRYSARGSGSASSVGEQNDMQVTTQCTGCFRCPAPDHRANDVRFHPRGPDGKRAPITDADKKGILARIEASRKTAAEKVTEREQVKEYWLRHPL